MDSIWAEKIAAEVAGLLGIRHAVVELAKFRDRRGSVTKSFAHGERVLVHGNEVLARTMPYDPDKRFGQSGHTLHQIFRALQTVFTEEEAAAAIRQFAEYIVIDALIGNTDRHHQNWGLLVKRTPSGLCGCLAPTFDHASSLGRELGDAKRAGRLRDGTVGLYSEKGRGAIFWSESGRYGPSPISLLHRAAGERPELFRAPIARVRRHRHRFGDLVRRVPDDWMSECAKDFAAALMAYNSARIGRCLK